jgi:SET domain-containing protein
LWFIKSELRDSPIDRQGVFALEPVRAGRVLSVWRRMRLMDEALYLETCRDEGEVRRSCVRLIGRHYAHENGGSHPDDFINHSPDPNVLYHMGVLIALRDVAAGEEFTIDYNTYFSEAGCEPFADVISGRMVVGMTPRESLLQACEALLGVLRAQPEWDGT